MDHLKLTHKTDALDQLTVTYLVKIFPTLYGTYVKFK